MTRLLARLWPRGLTSRTVLLLFVSLSAFHVGSLWMHHHEGSSEHMGGGDAFASTTVMAVGIVVASVLLVRWLTGPLRRLALTADSIGRGPQVVVPQDGPEEVQRLARALEAMQARIARLVDDRTQALAAVSHDLRTPITRMRLRAGFLEDPETQARMEADLDEMEGMISSTLAYLHGDAETEPTQLADVGVMLSTLCDAAADAGGQVTFRGPAHLEVQCRPVALRRAAANLIGNAVAYGGGAEVELVADVGTLTITVEDKGPGIPESELERVFEPFCRLEESRSRRTGGVGLGLTIARQAVAEQAGNLTLANKAGSGLRAVIALPDGDLRGTAKQEAALLSKVEKSACFHVGSSLPSCQGSRSFVQPVPK